MATQLNSRQTLRQLTGCCFALALGCFLSAPASAAITHSGTFAEDGNPENGGDSLSLTNVAGSTEDILQVVIDLSATAVTFDEIGNGSSAFDATLAEMTEVGFVSAVVGGADETLTLTFNDFQAGETFDFSIDLDFNLDTTSEVTGANIAGSQVTATFAITGGLSATMVDGGGGAADWSATAIPEPNTLALLGLGLTGLAWGGRRRR
jgi:hypothetical protein